MPSVLIKIEHKRLYSSTTSGVSCNPCNHHSPVTVPNHGILPFKDILGQLARRDPAPDPELVATRCECRPQIVSPGRGITRVVDSCLLRYQPPFLQENGSTVIFSLPR